MRKGPKPRLIGTWAAVSPVWPRTANVSMEHGRNCRSTLSSARWRTGSATNRIRPPVADAGFEPAMPTPPVTELTDRARAIFRLVVEGYLDSGQPVGSKVLAGEGGLNLSPAS